MPVKLYMDVHVPTAVTNQLLLRGVDVLTAIEDGSDQLDDQALLARSTALSRLMVTQDIRFCRRAATWQAEGKFFYALAFAHQLSITVGQFVRDLEIIAKAALEGECENEIFRLPF